MKSRPSKAKNPLVFRTDPDELENLYHVVAYQAVRNELLLRLYKEVGRAEPNRPPALGLW